MTSHLEKGLQRVVKVIQSVIKGINEELKAIQQKVSEVAAVIENLEKLGNRTTEEVGSVRKCTKKKSGEVTEEQFRKYVDKVIFG